MSTALIPKIFPVACHTDHIGIGSTFVAVKGMQEDGSKYIPLALQKGANKIVVDQDTLLDLEVIEQMRQNNIELVRSKNPRKALAQLSAQALEYPAKKLKIFGVTGTKGKTTTCFLLAHLLKSAGYKTALLSTVHNQINETILQTNLTTQHPDYLHVFFDQCNKNSIEYVVMEVAAQGISLDRIDGLEFDGVIFTNFDLEHSEFYTSMDDYFAAKCQIFDQAKSEASMLVNTDDVWCKKIKKIVSLFSLEDKKADYYACIKKNNCSGLQLTIDNHDYFCPTLIGEFNAYNMLAAISLLKTLDLSSEVISKGLLSFSGVPGRMQLYPLPNGARGCIDNAHNPSSYKALLQTLRSLTDDLIVIFGCGGQRDKIKRPLMGNIAAQYCDTVILTSDNPRTEDPADIMEDIFSGIEIKHQKKVIKEIDRQQAISIAYRISKNSSIIAILGKGHEEYQLVKGIKSPFSEREILKSFR